MTSLFLQMRDASNSRSGLTGRKWENMFLEEHINFKIKVYNFMQISKQEYYLKMVNK